MAPRRPPCAAQAHQGAGKEGPGLIWKRCLESACGESQPRLVLRLHERPHASRLPDPDPECGRRVHPRRPRLQGRALDRRSRCDRGAGRALSPTREAQAHALRQRPRIHLAKTLTDWLRAQGVEPVFIEKGSPQQNPYVERFNGTMRDERLSGEEFESVLEARVVLQAWLEEYNSLRPHRGLGMRTPLQYARDCREGRK
ncbi:MAG TPA: transposase [Gaiellaceae bacterium]